MKNKNEKLLLFTFSWPDQMDAFKIEVFASNIKEAKKLIKADVEKFGKATSGKYGPDYIYISQVKKGIRKNEMISSKLKPKD